MARPKIGAHVSVSGGIFNCVENAKKIEAETIQIFGSSPQKWQTKIPPKEEIKKFKNALVGSGLEPVFLHASYLVNLASPNPNLIEMSVKNLAEHLKIAELLDAKGLIFHVGSATTSKKEDAIDRAAKAIKKVMEGFQGKAFLIMENAAGGGQKIGTTIHELEYLFKKVRSKKLKICIDTAHAFEAGIIDNFGQKEIKKLFNEMDEKIGIDNIAALHINDSKTPAGSKHDRHENIGEGYIGLEGFQNLAKEKRAGNIPWILEVPGFDGSGPDQKNINILRSLFS